METALENWGYLGIVEKNVNTSIVYWGYIGIMEKNRGTTIVYWGYVNSQLKLMDKMEARPLCSLIFSLYPWPLAPLRPPFEDIPLKCAAIS